MEIPNLKAIRDWCVGKFQPKGDYLTKESDPTVPDWAKADTKPSYTADEVGADASGSADTAERKANTYTDTKIEELNQTVSDAIENVHTHGNKSVLDGITSTLIAAWDSAVTHISDTIKHITEDERTLWNEASKKVESIAAGTATGVKGNAETEYRTGNVNLTPEDIGAPSKEDLFSVDNDTIIADENNVISAPRIFAWGMNDVGGLGYQGGFHTEVKELNFRDDNKLIAFTIPQKGTVQLDTKPLKEKFEDYLLLEDLKTNLLDMVYPVGSIYMSVNNVSPASFLGGTWTAWGSGRVPVGVNTSDTNFSTVEKTGGASSVSSSHSHTVNSHAHTTSGVALTMNQMPTAMRSFPYKYVGSGGTQGWMQSGNAFTAENSGIGTSGGGASHSHGNTGNASPGTDSKTVTSSTLQPYITCYMWKRTA